MLVRFLEEGSEIPFFPGVTGKIVLIGDHLMAFYVEIAADSRVPEHNHPHEQMGICLQGEALFRGANTSHAVTQGMVYYIPAHETHSVTNIGAKTSVFIDFFSPPREDYIKKLQTINKNVER